MRFPLIFAAFFILLATEKATAQSWIEYANLTDQFAVNLPVEPTITESSYISEYGARLPSRVYSASHGESRYAVTVVDYTAVEQRLAERDQRTRGDDAAGDILGAVAYAAWNIRDRGGDLTYDSWAAYDRISGHQLQITNDDGTRTYAGIFRHIRRVYILEATVPAGSPPPVLFQQSLNILDGEGARIRYEYYTDEEGEIQRRQLETRERWVGDPPVRMELPR